FLDRARRAPDAVAIDDGSRALSYGVLDERSNRLARHLLSLGVGPEVVVAIAAPRSADLVVGVLAVAKAGGAYLPPDPNHPEARLRYMLTDSRAAAVLVPRGGEPRAAWQDVPVVTLDAESSAWMAESSSALPAVASPANAAYVIYTSGSTGRP